MKDFEHEYSQYLIDEFNKHNLFTNLTSYIQKISIPEKPAGGRLGGLRLQKQISGLWEEAFKSHRGRLPNKVLEMVKAYENRPSTMDDNEADRLHKALLAIESQAIKSVNRDLLKMNGKQIDPERAVSVAMGGISKFEVSEYHKPQEIEKRIQEEIERANPRPNPSSKKKMD